MSAAGARSRGQRRWRRALRQGRHVGRAADRGLRRAELVARPCSRRPIARRHGRPPASDHDERSVVTQALVADLAYFYRHSAARPPRFSLTAAVTLHRGADASAGRARGW